MLPMIKDIIYHPAIHLSVERKIIFCSLGRLEIAVLGFEL